VHCAAGLECGSLAVPLDWSRAGDAQISLALYRHRARQGGRRIGSLLGNPGGPGASGRQLAERADRLFGKEILDRFDIVSFDPRGVGASSPVRCGERLDAFFSVDRSPDKPAEIAANVSSAKQLAADCARRSGRILEHVSSAETVTDMEAIRAALGESRLSYLGLSYGTVLGAAYAVRYPARVRAFVLDGAVDSSLTPTASATQQSASFEIALDEFLASCSDAPACAFHSGGRANAALGRLLAQLDAEPEFARVDGEQRSLGQSAAVIAIATALYAGRASWPSLAKALAAAATGNGSRLLQLTDRYTKRHRGGLYDTDTEAFYAISCADGGFASLAETEQAAATAQRIAPRIGVTNAWLGLPCAYWPVQPHGRALAPRAPANLRPVLVVTSTGDPATPRQWGDALARQLRARLLTVDNDAHTAYLRGRPCVQRVVDRFLVTGTPPPVDLRC
jgi:pimeloyl-ACP methyl ester carboxylesterase